MDSNTTDTAGLPSVSTLRVSKLGRGRFAPTVTSKRTAGSAKNNTLFSTVDDLVASQPTVFDEQTAAVSVTQTLTSTVDLLDSIKKASHPAMLVAAKETRSASTVSIDSSDGSKKRLRMADLAKVNPEGAQPMLNSSANNEVVRRVPYGRKNVQVKLEDAPSTSMTRVLAPQVRIVDDKVVLDTQVALMTSNISSLSNAGALTVVHEATTNRHYTSSTYSRYTGSNRWSEAETQQFYVALEMCGTDFGMMQQLFPGRTRAQIKGKFKIEEKANLDCVNRALLAKPRPFDPALFTSKN